MTLEPSALLATQLYSPPSCSWTHVLMRDEKEGRSKQGHTNNKAKQHNTKQPNTPKAVTFPKKNGLPRVGFELTTLYTCTHNNTYTEMKKNGNQDELKNDAE